MRSTRDYDNRQTYSGFGTAAVRWRFHNQDMPYSKPMKMIMLWLTPDEKAMLEELAREEDVTRSHGRREGLKLFQAATVAQLWVEVGVTKEPYAQTQSPTH